MTRTIAKSLLLPVILSEAKNPMLSTETLRFAQGGKKGLCNHPDLMTLPR